MRPKNLDEYIGQEEVIGPRSVLRNLISKNKMVNSIYYGPPGTGKTSLAELISGELDYYFEKLNATTAGLADFREVVERAKKRVEIEGKRTLLFLDEIHRFNKLQQDALLPYTEEGLIVLVGATTENPYYNLNNALLSRCMVYEFKKLEEHHIIKLVDNAIKNLEIEEIEDSIKAAIVKLAGGDARIALNYLELYYNSKDAMSTDELLTLFEKRREGYHKKEDKYNIISAFIKSMRGSDPDAAIYWLARMLDGGEDPRYIARRLMVHASEDVGMANPEALLMAHAAMDATERIGMPEVRIILAQTTIYIAISSKSNSVEKSIDLALRDIKNGNLQDVPKHLKNQYSDLYKYPHAYEGNFVLQDYMNNHSRYYETGENKNEKMIQLKLDKLWKK